MYIKADNILINADHIVKAELTEKKEIIVTFDTETTVELFSGFEKDIREQIFEILYEALDSGKSIDNKMIDFKLNEMAFKETLRKNVR